MKKITLVILSVLIGFTSIARNNKHKKKQSGNEIISVELNRTGCYGRCPTYMVEINKDGIATYTAIRFTTDSIGTYRKKIGKAKAMEILNEINSYQVDTCKDTYRYVPDLPGLNLTIKYQNKTKSIVNAKNGPSFLLHLGKIIEDAGLKADDNGWKKVTAPNDKK